MIEKEIKLFKISEKLRKSLDKQSQILSKILSLDLNQDNRKFFEEQLFIFENDLKIFYEEILISNYNNIFSHLKLLNDYQKQSEIILKNFNVEIKPFFENIVLIEKGKLIYKNKKGL